MSHTLVKSDKYNISIDNNKYIVNDNFCDILNNIAKKRNVIELDYNTNIIKISNREYVKLLRNIKKCHT